MFIKDTSGCTIDSMIEIKEPEQLELRVHPNDTIITAGSEVRLKVSTSPLDIDTIQTFTWTPSEGLSCADCKDPIATNYSSKIYYLEVKYRDKCIEKKKVVINVKINDFQLFVPNAFSPNGKDDPENEFFKIYGPGIVNTTMSVYNRWGERVYFGEGHINGWDGTYQGEVAAQANYAYDIEVLLLNGETTRYKGNVTLIK
ncbi:MAG: gliding motility-associated C-terminal domain-containing protein [Bacteroidetes bacterium]|nr:gliding motility-associated C-terminal domain-containing protein [Bacteroidota bacterium]